MRGVGGGLGLVSDEVVYDLTDRVLDGLIVLRTKSLFELGSIPVFQEFANRGDPLFSATAPTR